VGSARTARAFFEKERVQFLVMEYPLPGDDGLALLHDFLHAQPEAHVIVLVNLDDRTMLERLLTAGARAVVHRSDAPGALPAAFAAALEGERFLSHHANQSMLASMAHKSHDTRTGDAALLSDREFAVFSAVAQKLGPKAIAASLGISVKTVETHKKSIKEKLKIHTAAELQKRADRWLSGV
jgi:two-component system response regulator NreC